MHKTGCTHIAVVLSSLFDGKQIGKHNAATHDQILNNRYFISSIRNPWDWYLSLWTFGVQGKGALMQRLTQKNLASSIKQTIELSKDTALWRDVYTRSDDIESFRKWLRLIHDPNYSRFLGEGYGDTKVNTLCGFMTYRYLCLCCKKIKDIRNHEVISTYTDLVNFENNNCYIDFFIRQESLEDDLCEAVEKVRPLTYEERERIYSAEKTNTSKRSLLISDYYDTKSIELIGSRDKLLIDKFGYSPPSKAEQSTSLDGNSATLHCRR